MSWWATLANGNRAVLVDSHAEGGTYVLGGTTEAELNITYNYSSMFRAAGIRLREGDEGHQANDRLFYLHGKTGQESIEPLSRAVEKLGTNRHNDYWKDTAGNAGYALSILLNWAKQHPDANWKIS